MALMCKIIIVAIMVALFTRVIVEGARLVAQINNTYIDEDEQ